MNQIIFPRKGGFRFKQFFVAHDKCAMKVGTDGVLLGAWAPLINVQRVLDIGCGSGLIALMLAQRSEAHVILDAVELVHEAAMQAKENVAISPWEQRIRIYNQDIKTFAKECQLHYQLIVSNPPYFSHGIACRDMARQKARSTEALTHEDLLTCAAQLMAPQGMFCLILPYDIAHTFLAISGEYGWHTAYQVHVNEHQGMPWHRMLLALVREPAAKIEYFLTLRQQGGKYSAAYRVLMDKFYLHY